MSAIADVPECTRFLGVAQFGQSAWLGTKKSKVRILPPRPSRHQIQQGYSLSFSAFNPKSFEAKQPAVPNTVVSHAQVAFKGRKAGILKQNPERRRGLLARVLRGDTSPPPQLPDPQDPDE